MKNIILSILTIAVMFAVSSTVSTNKAEAYYYGSSYHTYYSPYGATTYFNDGGTAHTYYNSLGATTYYNNPTYGAYGTAHTYYNSYGSTTYYNNY